VCPYDITLNTSDATSSSRTFMCMEHR
jgi:hypothetical protein